MNVLRERTIVLKHAQILKDISLVDVMMVITWIVMAQLVMVWIWSIILNSTCISEPNTCTCIKLYFTV